MSRRQVSIAFTLPAALAISVASVATSPAADRFSPQAHAVPTVRVLIMPLELDAIDLADYGDADAAG